MAVDFARSASLPISLCVRYSPLACMPIAQPFLQQPPQRRLAPSSRDQPATCTTVRSRPPSYSWPPLTRPPLTRPPFSQPPHHHAHEGTKVCDSSFSASVLGLYQHWVNRGASWTILPCLSDSILDIAHIMPYLQGGVLQLYQPAYARTGWADLRLVYSLPEELTPIFKSLVKAVRGWTYCSCVAGASSWP
jgi:hypothetical protein